ncbi:P-loop containing nucleoside triphosphate hydrolase protein [Fomitopsis serialis]|uniref:P-loop containing nucleoside triphosphate hydrolase protein n=1 Tax=Fomitopsis serialis TaxID=139415 RepID=UPI0020088886|nr:P-loop containing nucleoside triphosphate hydrolase protein [Neoantrodia serialis]KAH9917839.1 P-loop containing nucleoside triphosphate hydrolase protein [Neoantrodia serialis]
MAEHPTKKHNIWLLAQSNVAVKNIAEKLADILVSRDFHFDWHEHLYTKIERNVIRSDAFGDHVVGSERLLLGSTVILCTLSMLSSQRLATSGYTRLVPVETVIVDEASQIELGDYLPLLGRFDRSIKKLVFIGDDKQLAPYGQDDLGDMPSIFELQHLRQDALFLDVQYRMPKPIGTFISKHVYGSRLKTSHSINSRRSCLLVDVSHGREARSGKSWVVSLIEVIRRRMLTELALQNNAEADAIVVIARKFHAQGKTYRVITPYDAQRNALERKLKDAKLPWENKCFNVDSFQGNEEDYVLISVVRSNNVGFLNNLRRTNVMLSRCKRAMVVCTSRAFMEGKARSSLLGKLAKEWPDGWVSWRDMLQGGSHGVHPLTSLP